MNNNKRQKAQTERALAKKDDTGEALVPMRAQPQYPVPPDVVEVRNQQTADWSLDRDIEILRFHIARETAKAGGGNSAVVAQLAKAVESLVRTNVSTALRTGEWLSRKSAREYALAIIADASEVLRTRLQPDEFDDAIDELRERVMSRTSREAVAESNQRNEQL
jgi:hypothetical protein